MLPEINLGVFTVSTLIVGGLVFALLNTYVFWNTYNQENKLKYKGFDINFFTLIIAGLILRLIDYLVNIGQYTQEGLSLLPYIEYEDRIDFLVGIPWNFLRFSDIDLSFVAVVLTILVSALLVKKIMRLNLSYKETITIWAKTLSISSIVLVITFFLVGIDAGREDSFINYPLRGIDRFPIQLVEISILLALLVARLLVKNKSFKDNFASIYLATVALSELIIRTFWDDSSYNIVASINILQIFSVVILFVAMIPQLGKLSVKPKNPKRKDNNDGKQEKRYIPGRSAYSYANRKRKFKADFNRKEQLDKQVNQIKRRISK